MVSNRIVNVTKQTEHRLSQFVNEVKKPHNKTYDYIINKGMDALEDAKKRNREIEDSEIEIKFL